MQLYPQYFYNDQVLDILLHRLLELPSQQGGDLVETVLNDYGALFKFHGKFGGKIEKEVWQNWLHTKRQAFSPEVPLEKAKHEMLKADIL